MAKDIEEHIQKCEPCKTLQPKQTDQPMNSHEIPELTSDQVRVNIFEC